MKEIGIYLLDELPDDIQAKAIENLGNSMSEWLPEAEDIRQEMQYVLEEHGYIDMDIYFSLSYSQGDGAAAYGQLDMEHWVKEHPEYWWLIEPDAGSIVDVHVHGAINNRYHHHNSMHVEVEVCDETVYTAFWQHKIDELDEVILSELKEMSHRMEKVGYELIEAVREEDYIRDFACGNDTHFFEDGSIAPSWMSDDSKEEVA